MKHEPKLFDVPKDSQSHKAMLQAFKLKHGIWTQSGTPWALPWIAIWVDGARERLSEYGPEVATMDAGQLMASYCRLLEEGDLMTEGKTERAAVESLCIANDLPLP